MMYVTSVASNPAITYDVAELVIDTIDGPCIRIPIVIIQILKLGITMGAMCCILEQLVDVFGGDIGISVGFQISLGVVNDTLYNLNLKGICVSMG